MSKIKKLILILIMFFISSKSYGEERPTFGLLYHQSENSSLRYNCSMENDLLNCSFNQLSILSKSTEEDSELESKIKDEWKKKTIKFSKEECDMYENTMGKLSNSTDEKAKKKLEQLSSYERKHSMEMFNLILKHCQNPTLTNYFEFIKHANKRDKKTCIIRNNPYKQTFKKVPNSKENKWLVVSEVKGNCGILNISNFMNEKGGLFNWKYIAEKKVLNKENLGCSQLDENQYIYILKIIKNFQKVAKSFN